MWQLLIYSNIKVKRDNVYESYIFERCIYVAYKNT